MLFVNLFKLVNVAISFEIESSKALKYSIRGALTLMFYGERVETPSLFGVFVTICYFSIVCAYGFEGESRVL